MSYKTDTQLTTEISGYFTSGSNKWTGQEVEDALINIIDSKRNSRDTERNWINVTNNDIAILVADDSTDNKANLQILFNYLIDNGGGTLYFPAGIYRISGTLADTGNANAQVYFKQVSLDEQQIAIKIVGENKPPVQLFTSSPLPVNGYSIIKSTLTGASGTAACIGSQRENGFSLLDQNNVCITIFDMIFQAPPNPTFTMLDLRCTQAGNYDGVLIHTGNVNYPSVTEPTNTNAYGIKLADYNHTPGTFIGSIDVWGFYTGLRLAELCIANLVRSWSCKVGMEAAFSYHGNVIANYIALQCPVGIKSSGDTVLTIHYYDFEDVNGTGQAWQETDYAIDDAANDITGHITWDTIYAGVGRTNNFPVNGGSNIVTQRVGTTAIKTYTPSGSTDNTLGGNFTLTADDTYLYYRTSTGTWKKIAWSTF